MPKTKIEADIHARVMQIKADRFRKEIKELVGSVHELAEADGQPIDQVAQMYLRMFTREELGNDGWDTLMRLAFPGYKGYKGDNDEQK